MGIFELYLFILCLNIWVIFWEVQAGKMERFFFAGVSECWECWPSLPNPWIKDIRWAMNVLGGREQRHWERKGKIFESYVCCLEVVTSEMMLSDLIKSEDLYANLSFSLGSWNALKPFFSPLLQKKAISHILDHDYSVLDSPKANQSFPKAAKSLIKDQEEDKVVSSLLQSRICQNLFENLLGVSHWLFFLLLLLLLYYLLFWGVVSKCLK